MWCRGGEEEGGIEGGGGRGFEAVGVMCTSVEKVDVEVEVAVHVEVEVEREAGCRVVV